MKNQVRAGVKPLVAIALLFGLATFVSTAPAQGAEKNEFHAAGTFVEGCSCSIPCTCDVTGAKHGCQGVGAMVFTGGSYKGADLTGAKIAFATAPGDWIRFYVQAKNSRQEKALTAFAKTAFREFGKAESVKKASIDLAGKDGRYTLSVEGGKIIQLTTEPVLGGDKKTPIAYSNVFNPLSPTVMQAKTVKASYHDGDRSFTLEGSNSFFNGSVHSSGQI